MSPRSRPSPSSAVESARKALAGRLRDLRVEAGLTGKDLASAAGWHPSKSSRIENGQTPPSDVDIRSWCRACNALDQAPDLIAAARSTETMYTEWRRSLRAGQRRIQEASIPRFDRTDLFRVYSSNLVPGLLQTEAYAEALLANLARFRRIPDESGDAARARIERSERTLRRRGVRVVAVIEESVLRHQIGDQQVMAGQLGHLLSVMSRPAVSIGIIPFSTVKRPLPVFETFTIYGAEEVTVELISAKVVVTQPSDFGLYERAFQEYSRLAKYGAAARALVREALEALG